ncbi:aminodeoxychorismate synthase component I [Oceanicaulis sp. MMSF_3324]|uniref:aminodeoxychorismate synthase component I n=1 Tax=Oceanicaulis sp. MMSF_3324 TaxID=3046702 RepID=UPI00273DB6ED|nr:aminodeoxychorismate synthase component I [Oceanicaulis sp. MMSF_3324]
MSRRQTGAQSLDWVEPVRALRAFDTEPYTLLLQGGGGQSWGRKSYLCAFPEFTIEESDPAQAFERLRDGFRPSDATGEGGFSGGYAGLLGYDLGQAFERVPVLEPGLAACPAVAMGWYGAVLEFDHHDRTVQALGERAAAQRLVERLACLDAPGSKLEQTSQGTLSQAWLDRQYLQAVERARDYIAAGDIFQVNLSHAFTGHVGGRAAPLSVFERLTRNSPAAFSAYFRLNADQVVLTNSPERFLQVSSKGEVETRPIKGTRPRRADPERDNDEAQALAASLKDRAENLMIVDLMRNDLARVCRPGSVKTPELFSVESYANVHHLVSTVTGELASECTVFDLIGATFPPGSITGAPKVRAMEIIAELEQQSRGAYCGSLGWLGADGACDLNVMIRTASFARADEGWDVEVRSGGAITIDSEPQAELDETRHKAAALRAALEGDA